MSELRNSLLLTVIRDIIISCPPMPRKMGSEYVTSFSLAKTVQLSPGLLSTATVFVDISSAQASQCNYYLKC